MTGLSPKEKKLINIYRKQKALCEMALKGATRLTGTRAACSQKQQTTAVFGRTTTFIMRGQNNAVAWQRAPSIYDGA